MPLSEHEKKLLEEIEHDLSVDSPHLASALRTAKLRDLWRGSRLWWVIVCFLQVGLAMAAAVLGAHVGNQIGIAIVVVALAEVALCTAASVATIWTRRRGG